MKKEVKARTCFPVVLNFVPENSALKCFAEPPFQHNKNPNKKNDFEHLKKICKKSKKEKTDKKTQNLKCDDVDDDDDFEIIIVEDPEKF